MKYRLIILLVAVSLVACSIPPAALASAAGNATVTPSITDPISSNNTSEEAVVRALVENFGKRLQNVSLLAPDAAQEIQQQYSEFASPDLLQKWMSDVSKAPGRMVSSPWPDRIEITTLSRENPDRYAVTGDVIEITSVEVVNGGTADKIPVGVVVQNLQGHWLITEYTEDH